ncbi:acyltransferase [Marinilactibacillus sp. GCM10026970]|uniref:acyltransferase family protein n=1 Tax=Marinilactibacillus sp. GCM10026970 TaxID=3252642 RepID=UPI00361AED0B
MKQTMNRDKKIDVLRSLALLGIVLAHVNPPDSFIQLRSFDVPLMVLLMGISFSISNKNNVRLKDYLIKRVKKLVLPTWGLLIIFFTFFYVMSIITNEQFYFSTREIFFTFTFIDGIDYVWIIQVFISIAVFLPFLYKYNIKMEKNKHYLLFLFLLFIFYETLMVFSKTLDSDTKFYFEHFILFTIGYGWIAALGIRIKQFSRKEVAMLASLFLVIYSVLLLGYSFELTNNFKYPPTLYYFSYALTFGLFSYTILDWKVFNKLKDLKLFYYFSDNSFWLYLLHIFPIYFLQIYKEELFFFNSNFVIRFLFVLIVSIVLRYFQIKLNQSYKTFITKKNI